jgi:hypothetical protein
MPTSSTLYAAYFCAPKDEAEPIARIAEALCAQLQRTEPRYVATLVRVDALLKQKKELEEDGRFLGGARRDRVAILLRQVETDLEQARKAAEDVRDEILHRALKDVDGELDSLRIQTRESEVRFGFISNFSPPDRH